MQHYPVVPLPVRFVLHHSVGKRLKQSPYSGERRPQFVRNICNIIPPELFDPLHLRHVLKQAHNARAFAAGRYNRRYGYPQHLVTSHGVGYGLRLAGIENLVKHLPYLFVGYQFLAL